MLTSRKALLSNLNYVHLQHVSLGVHLSMHPEVTNSSDNQDTGVKDGCRHKWKDIMVDPNSNDPSMPCQCCDHHPGQEASLQYSSLEDLDTIICDECLSPDDLPLSPLSLSSPSTDSSSSSDFTLDDSPASMCYKEYSQDDLDTPDQQPDIIPLDVGAEGSLSRGAMCLSQENSETTISSHSSETNNAEIMNNNSMEAEDTPFIDWGSDSMVDSNSNTLIERSASSSMDSDTIAEPAVQTGQAGSPCADHWLPEHDLLPRSPSLENTSTSTPKKTITSFHELALRRRRSGGQLPSQPKKDRSDWLIVFSPDHEQPPMNELTASAFYHGILESQSHSLSAGKEVTTFRELRYRNALNKQSVQQTKIYEERPSTTSTEATSECPNIGVHVAGEHNGSQQSHATKTDWADTSIRELNDQRQLSKSPACRSVSQKADENLPTKGDHTQSGMVDTPSTVRNIYARHEEKAVAWRRGMADGGDLRGQEAAECDLFMADDAEDSTQRHKKGLLIAVGSSVEKIISHFNTSRKQVQKAQLGDSRLSPVLGYLILNHLCPSLYALIGDGLKPYQKDVIVGRRRLSPWGLVEASMKTGPENVHLLFAKVTRLTQLRDPQKKFNAFIFGLLNMKQLDVWVLHLHQIYDQLSILYLPSGFLPLAATRHLDLQDELVLSLQPLSALTFHTDLLFEHHHLSLQDLPTPHRAHSPGHVSNNWGAPSLQNILDLGGWITHNLAWNTESNAPALNKRKSSESPGNKESVEESTIAGDTSIRTGDITQPSSSNTVTMNNTETSPCPTPSRELTNNWWGHLSQASRSYIPANRESLPFTALRKLTNWGPVNKEPNQRATSSKEQRVTEELSSRGVSRTLSEEHEQQVEYMGAPPNRAFTQGTSDGDSCGAQRVKALTTTDHSTGRYPTNEKGNWLGQLFGASSSQGGEMEARTSKSRRPSSWLPPNVWSLIRKPTPPPMHEDVESRQWDSSRPQRSLRALCDHVSSGEAQLSFRKGDVLQLLHTVDEDWIQCRRGSDTGLVPVGYTSLIL